MPLELPVSVSKAIFTALWGGVTPVQPTVGNITSVS